MKKLGLKNRELRRENLREELKSREYLRQIHNLLKASWSEEVAEKTAKLNGYFRLLQKTLPDAREDKLIINVDNKLSLTEQSVQIINAVMDGEITTRQADSLMNVILKASNIRLDDDLEKRMKKLEREAEHDHS